MTYSETDDNRIGDSHVGDRLEAVVLNIADVMATLTNADNVN